MKAATSIAKNDRTPAIDNDYSAGMRLADGYLRNSTGGGGHRALITAMETAAAAGGEAVRGLGESLHEHMSALLREPGVGTATVQQQLQNVIDSLPDIYDTLESIHEEAEQRRGDGAPYGLFDHTAMRGMNIVDQIETMLNDIQHHRAPREAVQP